MARCTHPKLLSRVPRPSSAWAGILLRLPQANSRQYSRSLAAPRRPLRFNLHRTHFASRVVTEAAPRPVLRPFYEPTLHRIPMNVAKLSTNFRSPHRLKS